jgi:hypothetical protein
MADDVPSQGRFIGWLALAVLIAANFYTPAG